VRGVRTELRELQRYFFFLYQVTKSDAGENNIRPTIRYVKSDLNEVARDDMVILPFSFSSLRLSGLSGCFDVGLSGDDILLGNCFELFVLPTEQLYERDPSQYSRVV